MPVPISAPSRRVPVEPLTQSVFEPFGTVIENPIRLGSQRPDLETVKANQGTALKYLDVTHMTNFYHMSPSRKPGAAVMNMFVCSPRRLRTASSSSNPSSQQQLFDTTILERHPYTSQTFIPLGLSPESSGAAATPSQTYYLVIVAPTLSAARSANQKRPPPFPLPPPRRRRSIRDIFSRARPSPFTNEAAPPPPSATKGKLAGRPKLRPKGLGLPDLSQLRAFVARGDQAVTYGAGTWHAPMVVLGGGDVDFVVVQFANGVGIEDCQEVELQAEGEGIAVVVEEAGEGGLGIKAKL
ncbi:ureidoglycolate hydrolase [Phyllosticta citribraziliensis]|uniref:Ureidoglycolate hydrolase n=1 Tax=Phyllosticta citribraziliensis TaxID=989973 RepID=A0ABR1LZP6_9PEZI